MKTKNIILLAALAIIIVTASCKTKQVAAPEPLKLQTKLDTISYSIASDIAENLATNKIDINPEVFAEAFKNKIKNAPSLLTKEQIQKILSDYQKELQQKQQEDMNKESALNKEKAIAFLKENKKNPDVIETSSGLQYRVIQKGTSDVKPGPTSKVEVHYEGRLLDGSIFDSSYSRGESISFGLDQVIPGWTEALQLMTVGSKHELFIPSNLAYGDRNIPGIPAGSLLIFKVELLGIE